MRDYRIASVLNALYLFVLVLAAVFTYVLGLAVILGLVGAAWFLAAGFTLRGKLVEILVIVGFVSYLFFRGLLKSRNVHPAGIVVDCESEPALFCLLGEIASKVKTRTVNRVIITPGSHIGVSDPAGFLGMFWRTSRTLEIGYACLHALTLNELKAILAHEYAHFTSRETLFRRFVARVLTGLQSAIDYLRSGKYWKYSPVYHALAVWEYLFRYFSSTFCRQREYRADWMAAQLFGGNVLASGLMRFASNSLMFEGPANSGMAMLLMEGRVMRNVYAAFRAYSTGMGVEELESLRKFLLQQRSGLLDSHPCPMRRIARIRDLNRVNDASELDARSLFSNHSAMETELTLLLTGSIAGRMNILDSLRAAGSHSESGAASHENE